MVGGVGWHAYQPLPGGTLQDFLDETNDQYVADAAAGGVLAVDSVEWVGACLSLALEHLHGVVRHVTTVLAEIILIE